MQSGGVSVRERVAKLSTPTSSMRPLEDDGDIPMITSLSSGNKRGGDTTTYLTRL